MRSAFAFLWLACLVLFVACGERLPSSVSGTVTLDGAPLTSGDVAFHPVGQGTLAIGSIQPDGSYVVQTGTMQGLPAGDYAVTVVALKPAPPATPNTPPVAPEPLTPAKYGTVATSELKFAVESGSNSINLLLKSK